MTTSVFVFLLIFNICSAEFCSKSYPRISESSVTTEKLIKEHGYPYEEHEVQTEDGYILKIHRIPHSSKNDSVVERPVVFLQHGLLCTSSDWLLIGPNDALGYILSDEGYDVWMGNFRGNTYSKRHITKRPCQSSFWNFGWHEQGEYDLPAMINYVLKVTKKRQLDYIGQSQGTTTFFVMCVLHPKIQSSIKSATLLAPVAYMKHMKSPLAKIAAPLLGHPDPLRDLFGGMEILPSTKLTEMVGAACRENGKMIALCSNLYFFIAGFNPKNLNTTVFQHSLAVYPAGSSIFQFKHYLQLCSSGKFRQYDYGIMNKLKYNRSFPPAYNVENIKVKMHIFYSKNDMFTSEKDVIRLYKQLNKKFVKTFHLVDDPLFTHTDFLCGNNAKRMVHNYVIKNLK